MAVSEPNCDEEGELEPGTSTEASKRPCPPSDPEPLVPRTRSYEKRRKIKLTSSTDLGTSHGLVAKDDESNSLDTWTINTTDPSQTHQSPRF